MDGFPGLDLAHYVLHVAALIFRWPPGRARTYASGYLQDCGICASATEAAAIVALASWHAFANLMVDGHGEHDAFQVWRRTLWSSGVLA